MYKLTGEFSQHTARAVEAAGSSMIAQGQFSFDLSGLERIDSAAVAVMIEWQRQADKQNRAMEFHDAPSGLLSLIQLYGLTEQFQLASSAGRH